MDPISLVVGAGASIPFGLPSGNTLRWQIIEALSGAQAPPPNTPRLSAMLEEDGIPSSSVELLRLRLERGQVDSIDELLAEGPELERAGKMAIAYCIRIGEGSAAKKMLGQNVDNWVMALRRQRPRLVDDCTQRSFSIVTFNYDRCIEHALFSHLRWGRDLTETEAHDRVERMAICHVHGSIGTLRECALDAPVTLANLQLAAQRIRLPHESDLDRVSSVTTAKHDLLRSGLVCFLGFGFHPANFARLDVRQDYPPTSIGALLDHEEIAPLPRRRVHATGYRLPAQRKAQVEAVLRERGITPQWGLLDAEQSLSSFVENLRELGA